MGCQQYLGPGPMKQWLWNPAKCIDRFPNAGMPLIQLDPWNAQRPMMLYQNVHSYSLKKHCSYCPFDDFLQERWDAFLGTLMNTHEHWWWSNTKPWGKHVTRDTREDMLSPWYAASFACVTIQRRMPFLKGPKLVDLLVVELFWKIWIFSSWT